MLTQWRGEALESGHSVAWLLAYLLHNAPSNLRVVLAGRAAIEPLVGDLRLYGECVLVGAEDLRLTYEETRSLLARRFRSALDYDLVGQLHELAAVPVSHLTRAVVAILSKPSPCVPGMLYR